MQCEYYPHCMNELVLHTNLSLVSGSRREMLDNSEHLVVPAIAIKEGVLNNIFYPASELESFVETWNGVPVPVNHPMKGDVPVTANSVEVEKTSNIGRFYNVFFDKESSSIKGEIWLNISKAESLGFSEIIESLEKGDVMEVSTGLLAFTRSEKGEFNNTAYDAVIESIRPDHLALLPNEKGACSVEDGCGAMRTNCKKGSCTCGNTEEKNLFNMLTSFFKQFNPSKKEGEQKQNKMEPKEKAALVDALALALVANNAEAVKDESKASLLALPDEMLANMAKQYQLNEDGTPIEEEPSKKVEVKTEEITNEQKALLDSLLAEKKIALANKRKLVVDSLDHVNAEMAETMNETALDALIQAANISPVTNYSLAGGSVKTNEEEVYTAPSVFLNQNKKEGK